MNTQRQHVLNLLIEAGVLGVNSYDLTYKYSIKQAPTRVRELREEGYDIVSKARSNRSVTYVLRDSHPSKVIAEPKKQPRELQSWEKQYEKYEKDGRVYWREV